MPLFSPPVVPGPSYVDPNEVDTARSRLFSHFQVPTSKTVWIDQLGVVHAQEYPNADDLAAASVVYHGGHTYQVNFLESVTLLLAGLPLSGHIESEEQKWIDYALQATPNLDWMSGDGFATVELGDGTVLATFADNTIGTLDSDGYYDVSAVARNALFIIDSNGNITGQNLPFGTFPAFVHPTPNWWLWPLDITLDGAGTGLTNAVLGALELKPGAGFGELNSNVLVTLTAFGTVGSIIPVTLWGTSYQLTNIYNDTTHHYILASAPHPTDIFTSRTIIARAPIGQLTTIASWENWIGTGWSSTGIPVPIKDFKGQFVDGGSTITKVGAKYVMATTRFREQVADLYESDSPQGPYRYYHTSSHASPPKGLASDPKTVGASPKSQYFAYYQPKFHEHLSPAPTLNLVLSYNRNVFNEGFPYQSPAPVTNDYHVSTGCPQLVYVPTPEVA